MDTLQVVLVIKIAIIKITDKRFIILNIKLKNCVNKKSFYQILHIYKPYTKLIKDKN